VSVVLVDLVLGVALVATIALGARLSPLGRSSGQRRLLGWLLIAVPLPLAVGVEVLAPQPPVLAQTTFVVGIAAFAVGALLVLSNDDEDELRGSADPENPPWWSDFEREFRAYARKGSRPRVLS
jgi:hypothetical protein